MRPILFPLSLLLLLAPRAVADTHVVEADGSGDFPTLAAAISAAVAGDVIELGNRTFTGDGNRDLSFLGKELVVRSASGNPELCVIDAEGAPGAPHRVFSLEQGEGPGTRIEGITLTGGLVEGGACGGGLQVRGSASPTVRNCIFLGNTSACGGAVWVQGPTVTFEDCVFVGNSSTGDGGAVFLTDSSSTFLRCRFLGNQATFNSGAVGCNFASAPVFTTCTFSGNSAAASGVLWASADATPTFVNCTLSGNSNQSAYGIVGGRNNAVVTLTRCLLVDSPTGKAFACSDAATVVATCTDVYGNPDGDWVDCAAGQEGTNGNLSVDPGFCSSDPDADRYWWLQSDSPLADGNHPADAPCGTIGAWDVACALTPVEALTWGRLKATFR